MTAREELAEIKARADAHHLAASGGDDVDDLPGDPFFSVANWADKPHRLVYDLANDSRRLVAALTAVLDAEDSGAWRMGGYGDIRPWDREAWLKGYVFAREEATKAITEAMA